jgi:hypothetical protein
MVQDSKCSVNINVNVITGNRIRGAPKEGAARMQPPSNPPKPKLKNTDFVHIISEVLTDLHASRT